MVISAGAMRQSQLASPGVTFWRPLDSSATPFTSGAFADLSLAASMTNSGGGSKTIAVLVALCCAGLCSSLWFFRHNYPLEKRVGLASRPE